VKFQSRMIKRVSSLELKNELDAIFLFVFLFVFWNFPLWTFFTVDFFHCGLFSLWTFFTVDFFQSVASKQTDSNYFKLSYCQIGSWVLLRLLGWEPS
jgi:hypothetical protein